jgi:hypothetical protein
MTDRTPLAKPVHAATTAGVVTYNKPLKKLTQELVAHLEHTQVMNGLVDRACIVCSLCSVDIVSFLPARSSDRTHLLLCVVLAACTYGALSAGPSSRLRPLRFHQCFYVECARFFGLWL